MFFSRSNSICGLSDLRPDSGGELHGLPRQLVSAVRGGHKSPHWQPHRICLASIFMWRFSGINFCWLDFEPSLTLDTCNSWINVNLAEIFFIKTSLVFLFFRDEFIASGDNIRSVLDYNITIKELAPDDQFYFALTGKSL